MKKKVSNSKPKKAGVKSKDGFEKVVTGGGRYHQFEEQPEFIGFYNGETLKDQGKFKSTVHVFHNEAGDKVLINGTTTINQAIEQKGIGMYRFILQEVIKQKNAKGKLNGKTFKVFDIGFHK